MDNIHTGEKSQTRVHLTKTGSGDAELFRNPDLGFVVEGDFFSFTEVNHDFHHQFGRIFVLLLLSIEHANPRD